MDRLTRAERQRRAAPLAAVHGGVAHRRDLRAAGITNADVRSEVTAGRWHLLGRHTVQVLGAVDAKGWCWHQVWEAGSGAVLDGAAALIAQGLTGFTPVTTDLSIPRNNRRHHRDGARLHRRATMPPLTQAGIPRVRPENAVIHAAGWARTDREAALLLCLVIQQHLIPGHRLAQNWAVHATRHVGRARRKVLGGVVADLCSGAQSLGELDFATLCREWGLPEPTRQAVRLVNGRAYLDVAWEEVGLVVEVDGVQHTQGLAWVDDALRQNEVTLGDERVLRIPVLGLRLERERFGAQVRRAHGECSRRAA